MAELTDTVVTQPDAVAYYKQSSKRPGYCNNLKVKMKNNKFKAYAAKLNSTFSALAFEAYGRTHSNLAKLYSKLCDSAVGQGKIGDSPEDRSRLSMLMFQETAIALQVGNARVAHAYVRKLDHCHCTNLRQH